MMPLRGWSLGGVGGSGGYLFSRCTCGGVNVPCIYLLAMSELLQGIQVFIAVLLVIGVMSVKCH